MKIKLSELKQIIREELVKEESKMGKWHVYLKGQEEPHVIELTKTEESFATADAGGNDTLLDDAVKDALELERGWDIEDIERG